MRHDEQPEGATISRRRLAALLDEVERQDPAALESLLLALTAAAWPTRSAVDQ